MAIHPAKKRVRDREKARRRAEQASNSEVEAEATRNAAESQNDKREKKDGDDTGGDIPPKQRAFLTEKRDYDRRQTEEDQRQRERTESETPVPVRDDWSDPDTASIASRDSEDLYARRPNRWRGNARAWQHLTELDRAVVAAMDRTRDSDLAAHLYNAFFMKKTVEAKGITDPDDPEAWVPKASWTAWPLRLRDTIDLGVFDDGDTDIVASTIAESGTTDDIPVFRSHHARSEDKPSQPLEDMLTATIQKVAREQFFERRRERLARRGQSTTNHDTESTSNPASTSAEPTTAVADDAPAAVLADDELAADLLKPSVRHVLTQVDKILSILHNTRVATAAIGEGKESDAASRPRRQRSLSVGTVDDDTGTETALKKSAGRLPQPSKKRVCRRPSEWSTGEEMMTATAPSSEIPTRHELAGQQRERSRTPTRQSPSKDKTQLKDADGRGRPAKRRERLPGETEKQFLIRIARQLHKRIPDFPDEEKDMHEDEEGEEEEPKDQKPRYKETPVYPTMPVGAPPLRHRRVSFAEHTGNSNRSKPVKPTRELRSMKGFIFDGETDNEDDESDGETEDEGTGRQKRATNAKKGHPTDKSMSRWPLRDWTDVLGAAALSGGFSPEVLARTTQRCADLFGQSMALDTLGGFGGAQRDKVLSQEPLSINHTVYTPKAVSSLLKPRTTTEDSTAVDIVTLDVQRAHAKRWKRIEQRKAFMEKTLPLIMDQEADDDSSSEEEDASSDGSSGSSGSSDSDSNGSSSDDSDDDDNGEEPAASLPKPQARQVTAVPIPTVPGMETRPKARFGPQPKVTPTIWYCPRPNCPRALEGFPRKPNMLRHLKLVHGIDESDKETSQPLP